MTRFARELLIFPALTRTEDGVVNGGGRPRVETTTDGEWPLLQLGKQTDLSWQNTGENIPRFCDLDYRPLKRINLATSSTTVPPTCYHRCTCSSFSTMTLISVFDPSTSRFPTSSIQTGALIRGFTSVIPTSMQNFWSVASS